MGLLVLGTPFDWAEAEKYAEHVRDHGVLQFLAIWNRLKDRVGDGLLWGDEIEYVVVSFDEEHQNARLSLRQTEILNQLKADEDRARLDAPLANMVMPTFHPEYGRYMLESTPGAPYGATLRDLLSVETNMRFRRQLARQKMKRHEVPITMTSFPRLGVKGVFLDPHHEPTGQASHSLFLPDEMINPHVRFPTLSANIRRRRGSKVAMNMPIYRDSRTPQPFIDPAIPWDRDVFPEDREAREGAALPDHIYMDAMGFGMGCCCLQITFQACSVAEARRVYDALVPLGPIMLALTAAAPIFRGYLADVDCRWNVIAGSVDDRTEEERGLRPLSKSKYRIPKSRYDSVDSYISNDPMNRPEYNDNDMPINDKVRQQLLSAGLDELLANHIAHLFIRDPIVIFAETLNQDDSVSSDHFENLQSTNWQTLRFKPPPPGSDIGWRVEFRSMEVQLTDFENAAFSVFIVLLTRAILSFGLNFYMPISKVDENMGIAHKRNACKEQKFWFRKDVFSNRGRSVSKRSGAPSGSRERPDSPVSSRPSSRASTPSLPASPELRPVDEEYEAMSIDEIINGKDDGFPGLLGLIRGYLNSLNVDISTRCELAKYFDLISQRANGTLVTQATWIRQFVHAHPDYKHDSVVSQKINYDLCKQMDAVERGEADASILLGGQYAAAARAAQPLCQPIDS
ncbi:uncharacterized protein L969DRAFT_54002 [Mixia osmundae IAM 14324]|uniref:Glutamate--cysteine ligase n=1 Tax=Mixia osmundae (strain CBS 9802 / IAM 14324 / JCM 22182 / KY 12970) TaxID=764103 RepID=G7E2C4_MIXOS|nr:uncharacterized protein L969DRAFT_54002 [Mixia osmundae IAM 14324]KEI36856.1 hypothetical protein L969DRAFT_54002 [Mixia osmundae IAM 14324]GAA96984.1 hypothetical protein E5Q_03658 [Mixia osmundae IAM 14324]